MDGVDVGDFCGGDDAIFAEVGVFAGARSDADGFVGQLDVQRLFVGLRIDSDGFDTEFATSSDDPKRNFASVGDKDFIHAKT
jgi:hypothetical protein